MQVKIPIGKIIQEEVFKMNISLSELSDRMFLSKKTLLILFNSKTIEMSLLYRCCSVLKIDLFEIYSQYLSAQVPAIEMETISYDYNHKDKIKYEDKLQSNIS